MYRPEPFTHRAVGDLLHIGNVTIPISDYAVGASAVLGIRDSGKTVTSKGLAEQLREHDIPFIVFDAVGKWRWMKVPGEGPKGKGYKVVVAGGKEPDLPLNPHSVGEIVRSALKGRLPLIIDLFDKHLSKADWRRIVQTAIRIVHYENDGGAFHVFLEEAAEFVPQKIIDGETYAEVEKLVRMGGNNSVGITIINQRAQEVNKAVLDNCSTALILGCQVGNRAIENVEKWIERLDPETADELTASLPKLQSGEAWVWTRKNLDKPSRERIPMCRSFHPDRRTPETVLKKAKGIDPAEFVERMAASIPKVIEEAKANDPAELKKTINDLRRQLQTKEGVIKVTHKEVSVLTANDRKRITALTHKFDALYAQAETIGEKIHTIGKATNDLKPEIVALKSVLAPQLVRSETPRPAVRLVVAREPRDPKPIPNGDFQPDKCAKGILRVLSQYPEGCSSGKLTLLAGYRYSGGFKNSLSALRQAGCIEGENTEIMRITRRGLEYAPEDPLPSGKELAAYWLNHNSLGRCERSILEYLIARKSAHGGEALAALTPKGDGSHYEYSGGFKNALSNLRTAGLIRGSNTGEITICDELNL